MLVLNSLLLRRFARNKAAENVAVPEKNQAFSPLPNSPVPAWNELFSPRKPNKEETERENFSDNPQIILLLEKICSTLEQIAGNTERCLRKMESEDDLKFN